MGDRATFEIDGSDIILYSHNGGDISYVADMLREYVETCRRRDSDPRWPHGYDFDRGGRAEPDHLTIMAARCGPFDRMWSAHRGADVGDNGHFTLHVTEAGPTSEWRLVRTPSRGRSLFT